MTGGACSTSQSLQSADPESNPPVQTSNSAYKEDQDDRKSPKYYATLPFRGEGLLQTRLQAKECLGMAGETEVDRLRPRTTERGLNSRAMRCGRSQAAFPGAGQQVGSDRPGQEKQGERGTASQNALSLSRLGPVYQTGLLPVSLPHAVQKGTAEPRVGVPLAYIHTASLD